MKSDKRPESQDYKSVIEYCKVLEEYADDLENALDAMILARAESMQTQRHLGRIDALKELTKDNTHTVDKGNEFCPTCDKPKNKRHKVCTDCRRKELEYHTPKPQDAQERVKEIDWKALRDLYFNECVDGGGYVKESKVNLSPHNLFEWFKNKIVTELSKEEK